MSRHYAAGYGLISPSQSAEARIKRDYCVEIMVTQLRLLLHESGSLLSTRRHLPYRVTPSAQSLPSTPRVIPLSAEGYTAPSNQCGTEPAAISAVRTIALSFWRNAAAVRFWCVWSLVDATLEHLLQALMAPAPEACRRGGLFLPDRPSAPSAPKSLSPAVWA
jgi:hypothetical protein